MSDVHQEQDQVAAFDYDVTPGVVPYGSGEVNLLLTVANTSGAFLECPQIVFTVPTTLTTDPSSISPSSLDPNWAFTSGNAANEFVAGPYAPVTGLRNGDTFGLMLTGVEVVEQVGLAEIQVQETTSDGLGETWLRVTTVPPGVAITQFSVSALEVTPGASVTVTWSTTAATTVTLSYDGDNHTLTASGTSEPIVLDHTTTFTLTATGDGQPASEQIIVTVEQVLVTSISADPVTVAQGGQTTLSWSAVFADSFTIEPGPIPLPATATSQLVTVPEQATAEVVYTVTANGPAGTNNSESQVINVEPVQITSFVAKPHLVPIGTASTLVWATTSAISCLITPDPGFTVGTSGQGPIPAASAPVQYHLYADGYQPAQASATLTLGPIITLFGITFDPSNPTAATMNWTSVGGTSATFQDQFGDSWGVGTTGNMPLTIQPGNAFVYQITITDIQGNQTNIQVYLSQLSNSDGSVYLSSLTATCLTGINVAGETMTMSWEADSNGTGVTAFVMYDNNDPPAQFMSDQSDSGSGSAVLERDMWSGILALSDDVDIQFWINSNWPALDAPAGAHVAPDRARLLRGHPT